MHKCYRVAMRAPWLLLIILCLIGAAQGISVAAKDRGLIRRDLAAALGPAGIADLVRPGVTFNILSVTITGQTVAVHFTIQDSAGLPLDRLGVDTPGTV